MTYTSKEDYISVDWPLVARAVPTRTLPGRSNPSHTGHQCTGGLRLARYLSSLIGGHILARDTSSITPVVAIEWPDLYQQ